MSIVKIATGKFIIVCQFSATVVTFNLQSPNKYNQYFDNFYSS